MKLILTTYSRNYRDVERARFGINCPYAVEIRVGKFQFTIYRWGHPCLCISLAQHDPPQGGDMEHWAQWVLWQDHPWKRFRFWRKP